MKRKTARFPAGVDLAALLTDLEEDAALALVRERLRAGEEPSAIMRDCQRGMLEVGRQYEEGSYYLSGLIMAGEILQGITEILKPVVEASSAKSTGTGLVLLGTVHGDIHDIGKNMATMLLECNGFAVHDLGVDVPAATFLARAAELKPDIIGMSGLLTIAYDSMRETLKTLRASDDPAVQQIPVVIGGSLLTEGVARYVGTEYWARDAVSGLRLCQRLCGASVNPESALPD
ncbi:MAG: cobalamin B12-binding domain-containing protein [Deltaproteobacteria bacterium]|nr:cobalamin B12-binding domain-containing protein [Deltaproteobacteria bacterium]